MFSWCEWGISFLSPFLTPLGKSNTLKQRPKDEMQKSQGPHIIAEHQWYKK